MEGWLKKKGENLGAFFWKPRWFKEEAGKLVYYTDSTCNVAKGAIELKAIKDVRPRTDNFGSSSGWGFEIEVEGRVYCLLTSNETEQLAWINGLLNRLDKKRKFVNASDEWIQSLKVESRAVVVTITNHTKYLLERENFKLHGSGQELRKFPPEQIQPGESAVFGSCSTTKMAGTEASVTYQTRVDLDEGRLWFRWKNPWFLDVKSKKEALFQSPSRLAVTVVTDASDAIIYRVNYEVRFDPKFESTAAPSISHKDLPKDLNRRRTVDEAMEEDWVSLDHDREGPTLKPKEEGKAGQVISTAYGDTKYYADWIPALKLARRSVLVTIVNDTRYTCVRSEWSLKRGLWRAIPSEKIAANASAQFGTASHSLLGFGSGTIGSVTYIVNIPGAGDYVVTFSWKNHEIKGIHNAVVITTTIPDSKPEHGSLQILTESNNDRAYELSFHITDILANPPSVIASSSAEASTSSPKGQKPTIADSSTPAKSAAPAPRRTIVRRIQEDGITVSHTNTFAALRTKNTAQMKIISKQLETDLEIVGHHLIQLARKKEGSFFDSLFSKTPTLEEEADKVVPTRTPMPISTPVCPITSHKFASAEEKKYCYLCGRLVYQGVIVIIPFPRSCAADVQSLKKPPQGIQGCLNCNESLQKAERLFAWQDQQLAASKYLMHTIRAEFARTRAEIKISLHDLNRMVATRDKDAPLVIAKIKALFESVDNLELSLFGLNEDSSRELQKVNNRVAENVRNWKEELSLELQALEEACKPSL